MIEHVVADIVKERGLSGPDELWRRNSEGYRYLPWELQLFTSTGCLYGIDCSLGAHGMRLVEVFDGVHGDTGGSVGFDIMGANHGPFPPPSFQHPAVRLHHRRWNMLILPREPWELADEFDGAPSNLGRE